jgi:hypothetical protein
LYPQDGPELRWTATDTALYPSHPRGRFRRRAAEEHHDAPLRAPAGRVLKYEASAKLAGRCFPHPRGGLT